jgi:hypothetical protein
MVTRPWRIRTAIYNESFRPHDVDLYTMNANRTNGYRCSNNPSLRVVADLGLKRAPDSTPSGMDDAC